jgi:hypothetical protein
MRVLLSEEWYSHIYAEPFYQRFREMGIEAHAFKEATYFSGNRNDQSAIKTGSLWGRVQRKIRRGPAFTKLNADLLAEVDRLRPDVVFLFRGNNILPETLERMRGKGVLVVGWNNDDPFSPRASRGLWTNFVDGIPSYDRLWGYRAANVEEYRRRGCRRVGLLRSFYLRELNHPVDDVSQSPFRAQVSFIGHWEDDGRDAWVEALLREPGLDFKLWGTRWQQSPLRRDLERRFGPIRPLLKSDYNLAINSAAVSLAFLSKLNSDTYTRRNFEIPITGTLMLSEFTADLATLFQEGQEAEFFRGTGELMDKVRFYVRHFEARRAIGQAGRARVMADGHEALDRARVVVETWARDLAERS